MSILDFKFLRELIIVGMVFTIIGTIIGYIISYIDYPGKMDLPINCKEWNKNYIMEISLFVTAICAHIILELSGINKFYCMHGVACQKK